MWNWASGIQTAADHYSVQECGERMALDSAGAGISATAVRLLGRSAWFPAQLKDAELGDGHYRNNPCGDCYHVEHSVLLLARLRSQATSTRVRHAFFSFEESGLRTRGIRGKPDLRDDATRFSSFRVLYAGIVHSGQNRVLERAVTNNGYPRRLCWADLFPRLSRNCAPMAL